VQGVPWFPYDRRLADLGPNLGGRQRSFQPWYLHLHRRPYSGIAATNGVVIPIWTDIRWARTRGCIHSAWCIYSDRCAPTPYLHMVISLLQQLHPLRRRRLRNGERCHHSGVTHYGSLTPTIPPSPTTTASPANHRLAYSPGFANIHKHPNQYAQPYLHSLLHFGSRIIPGRYFLFLHRVSGSRASSTATRPVRDRQPMLQAQQQCHQGRRPPNDQRCRAQRRAVRPSSSGT